MRIVAKKALIFFCALLFFGIAAEIILRLIPGLETTAPLTGAYRAACFVSDTAYYWFRLKPNSTCTLTSAYNAFAPVAITSNSIGIRNPEILTPKPAGTIRALFLGDSFTMGWGVKQEESYPNQAALAFNAKNPAKKMEAVNAGLVFTAIGYEYLFLKNNLDTINPDVIVLGFYPFNDIYDTQFSSVWRKMDASGLPEKIESATAYIDRRGNIRQTYLPALKRIPFIRESRLVLLGYRLVKQLFPPKEKELPDSYLRICIYKPDCRDLDAGKARVKKLFAAIGDLAKARNIPVLVVVSPAEFIVYKGVRMPKYGIPYTLTPEEKIYPYQEFRSFFEAEGIPYLYLLPAFSQYPNEKLYFQTDDHWNPEGHRVAGVAIAEKITELVGAK